MTKRLTITSSAAAWLIGMYLLYARVVSPLVEPNLAGNNQPFATQESLSGEPRVFEPDPVALQHVPGQEWVKDAANSFHVGDIYLYANSIEQEEGTGQEGKGAQVRFSPFALVWQDSDSPAGSPPRLRITSDAAVIQFESSFDFNNPRQGRPVFGTLEGDVHIEGPDGLKIDGRGFTFSEQALRLWSDSDVQFQYGLHHGTGHGLQVDFLPGDEQLIGPDNPRLGGIRSVSLLREVALNLMGGDGDSQTGQKAGNPLAAGDELRVTSDGRMQYDMEANLITFDHNVQLRHPGQSPHVDGLNCDLLTLVLSTTGGQLPAAPSESLPANEPIALVANEVPVRSQKMQDWLPKTVHLEKLLADGAGKRRVEIFSPERKLHCNTAQVEYDLTRRVLTLRDPATVDVLLGPHQLHAPEIMLALHENNREILQAIARGVGTASSQLPDGRTVRIAWQKQMVKASDPATSLDFVEIQGAAKIGLDLDYELAGDALRVWFTPMKMKAPGPREPSDSATEPLPQIERVAGVGQVSLKSPQATARTRRLDVQFRGAILPPEIDHQQRGFLGLEEMDDHRTPGQRIPGQRGPHQQTTPPATPQAQPMDLSADVLTALILRDQTDGRRLALSEMWGQGSVLLTQPLKAGEPPVQVIGQSLHVTSETPDGQKVTLLGQPAMIRSGQSRLEGRDIRLDRSANTLEVSGAGVLQYAVNAGLDGKPVERPQLLQVKWIEGLNFNGTTADFYEKVEASLQQSVMRCSAMHVTMRHPVNFSDPQLSRQAAKRMELAKISCENKVEIDSAEYRGNLIISRSKGSLGQFVVDNITGKTEALGPGYFMEWRRGQGQLDNPLAGRNSRVAKAASKPMNWTYSRIDFQGLMKGNVHERFTTFENHVEIVYGPVPHATDVINPDELPEGAASITCDALKVEQFTEQTESPTFVKLSAEGNTKLEMEYESHPIYARADEVKFDESKDFYLLRSIGSQKVVINREPTTDDPRGRIDCSRVEISRGQRGSRPRIKFLNATGLRGVD